MSKNKKRQFFKKKEEKSHSHREKHSGGAKEFPKINLIFTENLVSRFVHWHRRLLLISFATFLIVLAIATISIDLYRNYQENKIFVQERIGIEKDIKFWQSATDRFPNYRDAYFELAVLNYQLKNFNKAQEYLNKVLKLDPNFKEGKDLERKIDKNI